MVPQILGAATTGRNFPRIRGDGPSQQTQAFFNGKFSPYSRGWSPARELALSTTAIFPVFAGMVP